MPISNAPSISPTSTPTSASTKVVSFVSERDDPSFNPARPAFLIGLPTFTEEPGKYFSITLPYVATLTFEITCQPDIHHFYKILRSTAHPHLFEVVTSLNFPNFYWFPGINFNFTLNPSLDLCAKLPKVTEVTLGFHTAGLTTSWYCERDRMHMEKAGMFERSKQLKVMRAEDALRRYGIPYLFGCRSVKVVKLTCYDSALVRSHCGLQEPLKAFFDLRHYIISGFLDNIGGKVEVVLRVDTEEEIGQFT